MNISLDFDETYTADPFLWERFVLNAKARNHIVYFVTSRSGLVKDNPAFNEDIEEVARLLDIQIIYCSWKPKRGVVFNEGIVIDVWIDDDPDGI